MSGLSGEGPARPLALADNGDDFGGTSIVGGIVVRPRLPSRSKVEKPWFPHSALTASLDVVLPWRHRPGNLLPVLVYVACPPVACRVTFDGWCVLLRIVGFVSLAAVVFVVASFVRFCFIFLLIFVKLFLY